MKKDLEQLEELKTLIGRLVTSKKRFIKLSDKRSSINIQDSTSRAIESADANLNWHAMEYDRLFREVHAVAVDCGLSIPRGDYSEIEYNPSPFHKYSHQPRLPMCRRDRTTRGGVE